MVWGGASKSGISNPHRAEYLIMKVLGRWNWLHHNPPPWKIGIT